MQEGQSSPAGLQPSKGTALLLSMLRTGPRDWGAGWRLQEWLAKARGKCRGVWSGMGVNLCSSEGQNFPGRFLRGHWGPALLHKFSQVPGTPVNPPWGPHLPPPSRILLRGRVPPGSSLGGTRASEGMAVSTERVSHMVVALASSQNPAVASPRSLGPGCPHAGRVRGAYSGHRAAWGKWLCWSLCPLHSRCLQPWGQCWEGERAAGRC